MKISIVTLSFNQQAYLREAIESILQQGYPELEYIIVDPGSTDGSRELIRLTV
jgi:glycosyltransferase involved in cell wall biosynthesis